MLVLTCAVFLLVIMPALLLWLGRMIEANTDGRRRREADRFRGGAVPAMADAQGSSGSAWYRRPMQPLFSKARRTA
jgi:hypothetical protein